jgi:hypothetical protein
MIQHLSTCCQTCVGSCGHMPSCQVAKATAPRGLRLPMLIRCGKPPSMFDRRPGPCPESRKEVGQADRW